MTTAPVVSDNMMLLFVCLFSWRYNPAWLYFHSPVAGFSVLVFSKFLDHTQRRATVGRTPLDERSIRRKYLYLTTHNTHNRQTSMSPVGFEPTILAGERPKTYALDRSATGIGNVMLLHYINYTGCPRKNVPDFGRVFLMLKYTDITQNTYVKS